MLFLNLQYNVYRLFTVHRVQASVASTLIFLNKLPMKLNPVIRPIMDSIKKEEQTIMQVCRIKLFELGHCLGEFIKLVNYSCRQGTKKFMSSSPGLVNFIFCLPNWLMKHFRVKL